MRVYILTINKVDPDPPMISSNFSARRHEKAVEYYASRDGALRRQGEIYQGLKKLVGFFDGVEVIVSESELRP